LNILTPIHLLRLHKNFLLDHQDRLTSTFKSFQQIHTMRLFLNVLAPFFLLNSFASASNYDFVVQWASAVAGACTTGEIASIETRIGIESNSVLAAHNCAQVAKWNSSAVFNGRRQLRERELGLPCSYPTMCPRGSTCYTNNYCWLQGYRKERELLQVERTLNAVEIAALESGLVDACKDGLDKEWSIPVNPIFPRYSVTCMAVMKTAIDENLCYSMVAEY
jgi:hypothetical protein